MKLAKPRISLGGGRTTSESPTRVRVSLHFPRKPLALYCLYSLQPPAGASSQPYSAKAWSAPYLKEPHAGPWHRQLLPGASGPLLHDGHIYDRGPSTCIAGDGENWPCIACCLWSTQHGRKAYERGNETFWERAPHLRADVQAAGRRDSLDISGCPDQSLAQLLIRGRWRNNTSTACSCSDVKSCRKEDVARGSTVALHDGCFEKG